MHILNIEQIDYDYFRNYSISLLARADDFCNILSLLKTANGKARLKRSDLSLYNLPPAAGHRTRSSGGPLWNMSQYKAR